uniref:ZP domain-containing protein n=1 Tax=Ascaris lumbricoides TaxID=6252 RepID=A0A0M3I9R6_ASCLU
MLSLLLIFSFVIVDISAIPVDNGVEGEPIVECGPTAITINFNVQKAFEGNIYVKGLFNQPDCKVSGGNQRVAGITLPFDACNTQRTRSLNPRGIFVTTVIVISFHPLFVTKVDRAYRLQCFYMEADKTVSTEIEVSEITTAFQTAIVPMPICRYDILDGGPSGAKISFATIGQQVYHKWTCDTETVDTFCAVVHSCVVDDGNGDKVEILNEEGCALDKYLLNNLEYPTDLMAGQEAHVYKYADRSQLYYQCQISISIKEPNSECPRPRCAEPAGFGAVRQSAPRAAAALLRRRRSADEEILDVATDLEAIDIQQVGFSLPKHLQHARIVQITDSSMCLSPFRFSLLFCAFTLIVLAAVFIIYYYRK